LKKSKAACFKVRIVVGNSNESSSLELDQRGPAQKDWADEIVAFANSDDGVFLASVDDGGNVLDISFDQIKNLDYLFMEISSDSIEPPVRILTHHLKMPNGKLVIISRSSRRLFGAQNTNWGIYPSWLYQTSDVR